MAAAEFLRGVAGDRRGARLRLMPRYRLSSNMTARPSPAGSTRTDGPTVQGALEDAIRAFAGEAARVQARGPHRCRRARHRAGRACRPRPGLAGPTRCATPSTPICAPHPVAVLAARRVEPRLRRPHLGAQAALPLPHRQPPRPAGAGREPGLAGEVAARRGRHARGGAGAGRQARLHHLPRRRLPGEEPR